MLLFLVQLVLIVFVSTSFSSPAFFYSTGYYPFGHFAPISYVVSPLLPSLYHTVITLYLVLDIIDV